MATEVELFPIEIEEFISAIQHQVNEAFLAESGPTGGLRFFPESSADRFQDLFPEAPSEDGFSEEDYLYLNPDVRSAVKRGEYKSGFAHWLACGKYEGRTFEHTRFDESEYLESNPDVASALRNKEYSSGREHWERTGRLEGRKRRSPMRILLFRLNRLGASLDDMASRLGKMPPTPGTIRGFLGRQFIIALRRVLWWYTASLISFGRTISEAVRQELACLSHLDSATRQNRSMLLATQESVAAVADRIQRLSAAIEEEARARATLAARLDTVMGELQRLSTHVAELPGLSDRVERLSATTRADAQAWAVRSAGLEAAVEGLRREAGRTRSQLVFEQGRITRVLEAPAAGYPQAFRDEMRWSEFKESNDALYSAFEDAFRGPRDVVRKRQSVYLPFIADAKAGSEETPILDLGCGRGEWIELLRDHHFVARGLDRNVAFVAQCQALGLEVEHCDALLYLGSLPDACLGGVTAFHVIEHIPFEMVLWLLDEIMRVLKPGGLLIVETPNPRNLQVGAHYFHFDPTHVKPLPPDMLLFFLHAKGFSGCRLLELHPGPVPEESPVRASEPEWLKDLLYGPRDYSIVARRP